MTTAIAIDHVGLEAQEILANLFEHYLHDMAEWFKFEIGADGRYAYDTSPHWARRESVYLARVSGALAGFALVGSAEQWTNNPNGHDVREFFVVRRHRRFGVGEVLARHIWSAHPGEWLVRVLEANLPAVPFWRRVTDSYTEGHYTERIVVPADGKRRVFFSFSNTGS